MNWYAIYTKPKAEETVSEKLRKAEIDVYNPKLKMKKYYRKRYREVVEPLFPCYIFVRIEPETHFRMITYTRGVKKLVGGIEGPWPVAEELIDFIRGHEADGLITLVRDEIREGDAVRIAEGPFAGLVGIFDKPMKGRERVMLLLNALEYQARVVVERASLIKVS